MNIFYLDTNPKLAAQYHCDKHVVKMILETAQLLSSAHRVLDGEAGILPDWREDRFYKLTHKNHPCAIWTRNNKYNYQWLASLGRELCIEYTNRYNRVHKTDPILHDLYEFLPDNIPTGFLFQDPPQCMPDEYKNTEYTVVAYREYYLKVKHDICQWKYSEKPFWFT